jgi:hypothetical protein
MYPDMVKTAALTVAGKTKVEIATALGLNIRNMDTILKRDEVREMVDTASRMVFQECISPVVAYHKGILEQAVQDIALAQEARNHGNHRLARRIMAETQPYMRLADCAAQRLGQSMGMLPSGGSQTIIQQNLLNVNGNQIISPGIANLLSVLAGAAQPQPKAVGAEQGKTYDVVDVEMINAKRGGTD